MMRVLSLLFIASLAVTAACGDSSSPNTPKDAAGPGIDATKPVDASVVAPDAGCFPVAQVQTDCANAATSASQCNIEIINACTTAQQIFKVSNPPLTLPDGGLPPLPTP